MSDGWCMKCGATKEVFVPGQDNSAREALASLREFMDAHWGCKGVLTKQAIYCVNESCNKEPRGWTLPEKETT